jgi:hypothetical protein
MAAAGFSCRLPENVTSPGDRLDLEPANPLGKMAEEKNRSVDYVITNYSPAPTMLDELFSSDHFSCPAREH